MPFKGIPRSSVYIKNTVPCILGIKHGTPFNKLKLPYKRNLKYFIINIQTRPVTQ